MNRETLTSTSPPSDPLLFDVRDLEALLKVSARQIGRLAANGRMPKPLKLGRLTRWRRADIESWLAGGAKPVETAGGAQR